MNKLISVVIAVAVVVGGGAFYAGMRYNDSKVQAERQARAQQFGGGNNASRGQRGNGGFVSGEVIAKDDKSVTVKLQSGGSKIVLISDSTLVAKSVSGSLADVAAGEQVMVTGSPNADGSINAQSIQIRPTNVK